MGKLGPDGIAHHPGCWGKQVTFLAPALICLRNHNFFMNYLDRLKKVAGTDRIIKKTVEIKGQDFSFWMKPLTIAESQAAQKLAKSDDANDFALAAASP